MRCRPLESIEIKDLKAKNKSVTFKKLNFNDFGEFEKIIKENDHLIHLAAILGTSKPSRPMTLKMW